jgi:cell division protein FtsQ
MSGLVRAEKLFRARQRARRRRASWPLVAAALAVTVVGGAVWTALYSPLLRLTSVTVQGTSRLSVAEVIAAARAPVGRSLLAASPGSIQLRVQRLPAVASARVAREWPHRLVITVVERTPVAAVGTARGVVLVDGDGVAFAAAPTLPLHLLDLRVGGAIPGPGSADAKAGIAVWTHLPAQLRRQVTWVDAASPDAVSFGLARGGTVMWGSADDTAAKLAVLATLLRQRAHVYDVSTPAIAVTR